MVHFVGAGPGAKDLITLRGKTLLEGADIVIYTGSLVSPDLLDYTHAECMHYNSAYMTLAEVMEIILSNREKDIVRLHTGDPSLYGAIQEQMAVLRKEGIPFEICPGVSSFSAAAAALETEYTPAGVSQTVIISRMAGRTPVPESLARLAEHKASMVLFLSAGLLAEVMAELLAGGIHEDMPAAIVYKASWPEEKVLRCTVATLEETARTQGIRQTALIVVGHCLQEEGEPSLLYSPHFETGYRKASS